MKTNLLPPRLYVLYINRVLDMESKCRPIAVANNIFPNFASNLEIVLGEGSLAQYTGKRSFFHVALNSKNKHRCVCANFGHNMILHK